MANRFDQPQPQRYVSTFVPEQYVGKPLEALTNLAKDYSDKYKQAGSDISSAKDEILKVNAINKHNFKKKELLDQYNSQLDELAQNWLKNPTDYSNKLKLDNLIKTYRNDPLRNELETSYSYYNEDLESLRKLSSENKYGYWNDNISKFNSSYKDGEFTPYRSTGIKAATNHADAAKKLMGKIAADGSDIDNVIVGKDGITRGYKKGVETISSDKVLKEAYQKADGFLDSPEGQDFIEKVKFDYPNATQKDIYEAAINLLYSSASEQIFSKGKKGYSEEVNRAWKTLHDEQVQKDTVGSGQTIPGDVDLLNELPENIKNKFKRNKKTGLLEVDFSEMSGRPKGGAYSQFKADKYDNAKGLIENSKELIDFLNKAKEELGYTKKVSSENINEIINQYEKLNKVLKSDYELTPAERNIEKNRILKNKFSYEYFDKNGKKITDPLIIEEAVKTFDPSVRTNIGGLNKIKGKYVIDGEQKQLIARNLSLENNSYFDVPSKQQESAINYVKTGSVDPDVEKISTIPGMKDVLTIDNKPGKIIDAQFINNHRFITVADPHNRTNQIIKEVIKAEDGSFKTYTVGTPKDFNKLISKLYYNSDEGSSDLQNLATDNTLYKDLTD